MNYESPWLAPEVFTSTYKNVPDRYPQRRTGKAASRSVRNDALLPGFTMPEQFLPELGNRNGMRKRFAAALRDAQSMMSQLPGDVRRVRSWRGFARIEESKAAKSVFKSLGSGADSLALLHKPTQTVIKLQRRPAEVALRNVLPAVILGSTPSIAANFPASAVTTLRGKGKYERVIVQAQKMVTGHKPHIPYVPGRNFRANRWDYPQNWASAEGSEKVRQIFRVVRSKGMKVNDLHANNLVMDDNNYKARIFDTSRFFHATAPKPVDRLRFENSAARVLGMRKYSELLELAQAGSLSGVHRNVRMGKRGGKYVLKGKRKIYLRKNA